MRRHRAARLGALALAATAFASTPGLAQDLPFGDGEVVTVVDELVVRAFGGPAWWKVSDADTVVYVLASPGPVPADLAWNTVTLKRRVTGANVVILPPTIGLGLGAVVSIPKMIFQFAALDNEGERMERKLDAALRTRFVAARDKLGRPEERYGAHPPGMAAMLLAGDAYEKAFPPQPFNRQGFRGGRRVEAVVRDAARDKNVPVDRAATYGVGIINDLFADLRKPGVGCVAAVLDELDQPLVQDPVQAPDGGASARAWAEGDVRPLLERASRPRGTAKGGIGTFAWVMGDERYPFRVSNGVCAGEMTGSRKIIDGFLNDQVKAITKALEKPGHAVALVSATDLLRKDGVLDQLRRQGFTVTLPAIDDNAAAEEEPAPAGS